MNQFDKININTKLKANPILLLTIWLLLIIIPFIILTNSVDNILSESEQRLLTKAKIQLIDEIKDFQDSLTTEYYVNSKLACFNITKNTGKINANTLTEKLQKHTKSRITALFHYENKNNKGNFNYYISDKVKKDFSLLSTSSMKNYLLSHSSDNYDKKIKERSIGSFNRLMAAAGGINLELENATPILSGKQNLGKIMAYLKKIELDDNEEHIFLCLFKINDIPLKEIIKNAESTDYDSKIKREVVSLKDYSNIKKQSKKQENPFYKYELTQNGLSLFAKASEELFLRISMPDSYYPSNLDSLYNNEPVLKVTVDKSSLKHPMREIVHKLQFPNILLIILATFALTRIGIYGYSANIHILGRVVLCVLAAVLLPFTSFIVASFYNQFFSEEYLVNEIQHYTQIQTKIIDRAIDSFINSKELAITELRTKLSNISPDKYYDILYDWRNENRASIISYNINDGDDIILRGSKDDFLSEFGHDAKSLVDIGFKNSSIKIDDKLKKITNSDQLESLYGFKPSNFAPILNNIGGIYHLNEANSLYSLFPLYSNNTSEDKNIIGTVLIKYDTTKLLDDFKEANKSKLFFITFMGDYTIRNAIIPLNEDGTLPGKDKIISSDGFTYDDIMNKIIKILNNKSQSNWVKNKTVYSCNYLSNVNALLISKAERTEGQDNTRNALEVKNILFYIVLMVIALSVLLGGIIVTPIRELQKASEKVTEGDYTQKVDCRTGDEFETLGHAFNGMLEALIQKEKMTSYVSQEVINEVANNSETQLEPSGERINVSVLFCALKGKKPLSEYAPEEVTKIISSLIDAVDEISTSFDGQVDKLIEDTVMVVFRRKNPQENIVLNACRTALAINQRLKTELPDFKIKMGIGSGDAVSGKIGSRNGKLDFTVIGNPVNLAARLKVQADKAANTGILICPYSIREIHGAGRLKFIERMTIKGRTNRTFPLYELLGIRDE